MASLPSRISRNKAQDVLDEHIGAFESEVQAVIQQTSPGSEHRILHILALMFLLTFLLMTVVKLDRVATAPGQIVPTGGSLYVQPMDRAIVRAILVRAGDVVHKGQPLATLDPTFAAASEAQLAAKVASETALIARLEAEIDGRPFQTAGKDSPHQLQLSIWRQRQSEYASSLADYDARIASTGASIKRLEASTQTLAQKKELAIKIEGMATTLRADGYGTRLREINTQQDRIDTESALHEAEGQLAQNRHDLESLKAQRAGYIGKWQDDLATNLVTVRDQLSQDQQDLAKAQRVKELITLEAPADSVVLQIADASVGSVVDSQTSGQALFTLVPIDGALEAEVQIDNKDIGFVKPGAQVEIKLDAYPFTRHGTVQGTIKTISEGSFTPTNTQAGTSPYFKARVAITGQSLRNVPDSFRLIPGMTLSADVMIGKRTIISYLVTGVMRTGSEAMREP
jgi:HlyD family type I secretion membrane fusion protein